MSDDPEEKMPPPDHGRPLSAEQMKTLRRWIKQGAVWEKHWSLIPPCTTGPRKYNGVTGLGIRLTNLCCRD